MAPYYEVEHTITGRKIREKKLARGGRIIPGVPTIVNILSDNRVEIIRGGKRRIIKIAQVASEQVIFPSNEFGKIREIVHRGQ